MNVIQTPHPERAGSVDFVDGHTRFYGILGHPIEQVRSPQTFTFELRRRGINAILLPIHIRPDTFDEALPGILKIANLDGLVVTIPHKQSITRHLDRIGPIGELSGGVSIVARTADNNWVGEMFDGNGCVKAILERDVPLRDHHVALLGAGGAGTAIAVALARFGVAKLWVREPNESRLRSLVEKLSRAFPNLQLAVGLPPLETVDVLINASPVGMLDPERIPIEADEIPRHVTVMDAIMDPDRTRLLELAEACGCTTVYGREMLDSQIIAACDFMIACRSRRASEIEFPCPSHA